MDRLTALDAEFLHLEDGIVHMHIAGACVFDDPAPSLDELQALVASKLHLIPRYRQRIRHVPLALGRPVWVDDPHFDLGSHLHHTALPAPGDDDAFERLMGQIMSHPLDRHRPLWEGWLVEGLAGDRWAIVFKVHHCMVDGIAGVQLLTALLDLEPVTEIGAAEPWTPEPEPSAVHKVLDAWGGLASNALGAAKVVPHAVAHPTAAVRRLVETAEGTERFVRRLTPSRPISIEGSIGPRRSWAFSSASLADVKEIRAAYGGTINDVVLTAVSGGYRALLLERGDDADDAVVTSLVPVSTRREDAKGVPDNRVAALLYNLPVRLADPVERLRAVHAQMTGLKASHTPEASVVVTEIGNLAPPMLVGPITRVILKSMERFGQRSLNTVTTNVPGPQFPLYCLGHEMLEYRPFVPISHGLRVGTAILSYNGRLYFGITGDAATVPDVAVLADATAAAIGELRTLAHDELATHRPRRQRPAKAG